MLFPFLSYLTNWKEIIESSKDYIDEYWFENLNLYSSIKSSVFDVYRQKYPRLSKKIEEFKLNSFEYWEKEKTKIESYCNKNDLKFKIYFHHGRRKTPHEI